MNVLAPARSGKLETPLDVMRLRQDFPILSQKVHGQPLVFLDTAASAQKPRQVIDAMSGLYETGYANIHRGVYWLRQQATDAYEGVRDTVARFINAPSGENIVFTRNATEAVNLVASSWARTQLQPGDEILITALEHHANIVPWHLLQAQLDVKLKVLPVTDDGDLITDGLDELVTPRTRLFAINHVSNSLGTINDLQPIISRARANGSVVLVDGCQAVPHMAVDVQALDADFYVFSAHKLYGPTGIGVLYGRSELLDAMPPYQGGGDMIEEVSFERTSFKAPPHRFEAGTPAIAEAVGLGAAIDYVNSVGIEAIGAHERALTAYARERLAAVPGVRLVGNPRRQAGIISFVIDEAHPHDIGTIIDRKGIAIRAGNHCTQPLLDRLGVGGTARASFGLYNTFEDVDRLIAALDEVRDIFGL